MTTDLLAGNILSYGGQVLAVVAASSLVVLLLRSEAPRLRLAVWHGVLLLCVLLPVLQAWQVSDSTRMAMVSIESGPATILSEQAPAGFSMDWLAVALLVLAVGAVGRLSWLAIGLYRLRRYRLQSRPMSLAPAVAEFSGFLSHSARFYTSDDIRSPVTFGVVRPVVLLPSRFGELATDVQRAVICHELLHVQRRDWLYTVAEEVVRAVLWFHPAIWWLISQIQLTREQVVDREVLDWIGSREPYMEGLLAISGAGAQLDLAPASLFLKKRHLNQRVEALLQERTMSKRRIVACLSLLTAAVVGATWIAIGAFPLHATPQLGEPVKVPAIEIAGPEDLLHRTAPRYPQTAKDKRIEGAVDVEVSINENGSVSDARVISGPEELRASALRAVLGWHYSEKVPRPSKRIVTLNYRLPPEGAVRPDLEAEGEKLDGVRGTVERIDVSGLSGEMHAALLDGLPMKVGDVFTNRDLRSVGNYLSRFDEHFRFGFRVSSTGGEGERTKLSLRIQASPAQERAAPVRLGEDGLPKEIRVGGAVQASRLAHHVAPKYPPLARQARVQGNVVLRASIDEAGKVEKLELESGHPLLVPAALEAVKQWEYKPTVLNGQPVKVQTPISVTFRLSE